MPICCTVPNLERVPNLTKKWIQRKPCASKKRDLKGILLWQCWKHSITPFYSIRKAWMVWESFTDRGFPSPLFRVWLRARSAKSRDLSAIQPYSWDLLRSVFKLIKLGRLESIIYLNRGGNHLFDKKKEPKFLKRPQGDPGTQSLWQRGPCW